MGVGPSEEGGIHRIPRYEPAPRSIGPVPRDCASETRRHSWRTGKRQARFHDVGKSATFISKTAKEKAAGGASESPERHFFSRTVCYCPLRCRSSVASGSAGALRQRDSSGNRRPSPGSSMPDSVVDFPKTRRCRSSSAGESCSAWRRAVEHSFLTFLLASRDSRDHLKSEDAVPFQVVADSGYGPTRLTNVQRVVDLGAAGVAVAETGL